MESSNDMDVEDFTVVLNSDSESVLVKGLRRFACQIRRDHGLLHHEEVDTRPPPPSLSSSDEESSDGDDSGGTDEEDNEGTRTPMELEGDEGGEGGLEEKERREAGVLGKRLPLEGRSADGGTEKGLLVEMSSRCTAALDTGEAAGLLGEYLRGSPQLHDLFSLWDLDVRKSSRRLAAVHTDSIAAVLECLSVVLVHSANTATGGVDAAADGVESIDPAPVRSTPFLEATGLGLCRKLIRDKIDELYAQLSTPTATKSVNPAGGVLKSGSKSAMAVEEEEERAAATLRLLTSMARFHRLAVKELAGVFQFTHKMFLKIVSRRGSAPQGDAASSAAGSGKKEKKRKLSEDIAVGDAQRGGEARAPRNRPGGWNRYRDLRHLSVDFLCSFMDSEDPAVQMQMVTGSRGGSVLGLIFRGTLWRDSPATSLRVVETLHRRLLRNRRVSRRSKADFFSAGTVEHLRKVFDDASPILYTSLHGLLSSLLCDPTTSPFLLDVATPAAAPPANLDKGESVHSGARDKVIIVSPRPLMAGLACLGAHEDLGQRALLLSALKTCPSLLGAYLRSFPQAVLEARPTYRLLQTYSLLSTVLREIPIERGDKDKGGGGGGRGFQGGRQSEALLWTVMPVSLTKKELTKGVLSGNPLLQASTMTLMASILDRAIRVAAAGAANSEIAEMTSRLRHRMPEVQTLLGLRDTFGSGSSSSVNGASDDISGHLRHVKTTFLRWRLLSLLDRYAAAIPEAITASRFDFFKLISPSHSGGGGTRLAAAAEGMIDPWEWRRDDPLVQLAMLRLLAREGVAVIPAALGNSGTKVGGGQSGSRASLSGWLAERPHVTAGVVGLSSDSMTDGVDEGNERHAAGAEAAAVEENTPLGSVLRVAIASDTRTAIRRAARALAGRALQSMGIVSVRSGGGESARRGREMAAVEDEADVWLDSLTLGVLRELVCLVKSAFVNAHALMAAGIRAAAEHNIDAGLGDWEVEFSPLSMAAVHALAGHATIPVKFVDCGDGNGGAGLSVEAARMFSAALRRVVHLHEDPRPFVKVCATFAVRAARAGEEISGGDGGRLTSGTIRTFRGLAESIARLAGHSALTDGDGDDVGRLLLDRERKEAETALRLLLKTAAQARRKTSPAAASEAAARLSSVLEDSPGINAFSLGPIVKELSANVSANVDAAASSKLSSGQSRLHRPRPVNSGNPAAKPNAKERGASQVLLDRVSLQLFPRLLADSLTPVEDDAIASAAILDAGGEILDAFFAETGKSVSLFLPAANEGVFSALIRILSGPEMKPARAASAVRQIISHLDLFLDRRPLGTAAAKENRPGVSLFSTGMRLVSAACLGLLAVDRVDVPVGDRELPVERGVENSSGVSNVDNSESEAAADRPSWRIRRSYAFGALADVFRRPFLLRLACPACFDKSGGSNKSEVSVEAVAAGQTKAETEKSKTKTSTCSRGRLAHHYSSSLGEVACTEMSALLVAAAAAADTFEEAVMIREVVDKRCISGLVAEAAGPFLEGLCGSVAAAVTSNAPELRWLSPALIACRCLIPEEVLSPVLLAVLERLAMNESPSTRPAMTSNNRGMDDGERVDVDASARSLLEKLLTPSTRRDRDERGALMGSRTVGGRAPLVRKLDPESVAALVELQVASPSPELGRLVALVLAEISVDSLGVSIGGVGAPAALTAVTSGLLDDESVFRYFFGCLVVGDANGVPWSAATDIGDSHDAMILEELVRYSPAHAHRLAISLPKALCGLPSVPSAAAVASLLHLRRPLEALLRTGALFPLSRNLERNDEDLDVLGSSAAIGSDDGLKHEGKSLVHNCSSDKRMEETPLSTSRCSLYPELSALLPGCIVPLFNAAAERARDGVGEMVSCLRGRETLLSCLDAVLEAVEANDVSGSSFKVATSAFRRSISGNERSEKVFTSPHLLVRARARAKLFAWLTADAPRQPCGGNFPDVNDGTTIGDGSAMSGSPQTHLRYKIRKAYLLHCLSRVAAAAKVIGRAPKKVAADAAQPEAGELSGVSAEEKRPPPLSSAESLCGFLLKEVASIIGDAQSYGEFVGDGNMAARLLGLCQHDAASAGNRGVVHAFLTAVLKHRLGDPLSLLASRMVASILYEGHLPVLGRGLRVVAGMDDGGGGRDASDILPGWSASMMLERVVGHSNFFPVLTSEGPSRAELLKLLVLLLSAGGGVMDTREGRKTPPSSSSKTVTAARGAGTVLVRPLLALYGASLSEEDQLVARSLRLLQASGVLLDPSVCLSWGKDTTAASGQGVNPGPKGRRVWRLIEALESRRLRVSIEAFPIMRELEPPSYSFEVGGEIRKCPDEIITSDGKRRQGFDYNAVEGEHGNMEAEEGSIETDGSESENDSEGQNDEKRASGYSTDGGDMEVAVDPRSGHDVDGYRNQIYDPCFLLPLVEWALRTEGVTAQAVCECSLLGYIITATSSLRSSTRAAAFTCLTHLLDSLQQQQDGPKNASSERGAARGAGGFKGRRTTSSDAAFRQRPQLALLLRCLKDGLETPLQRVPCAVALVLARVSETLASSPFSDLYKVFNSFLLHRPCIRLNELPLFDTLFTGVQPGEAGRGATGGGALSTSAHDPAAAAAKSRLWMLRALRDGMRTSQDLELTIGKRALPLLLAMANSPVGDGDTVFVGLVLDVLRRVARLRVSGVRYLLNAIGVVAWCRVMLGRGLSASDSPFLYKGRPTDAGEAGAVVPRRPSVSGGDRHLGRHQAALPLHLQSQIMFLLEHLLRCGRRLVPSLTPSLLDEEFVLLAPDIVRCTVNAAEAGVLTAGDPGKAGHGGQGKNDGGTDLVVRSISLLEELQGVRRHRPYDVCGSLTTEARTGIQGDEERGRPGKKSMLLFTLGDALSLVSAVSDVADAPGSSPYVRGLKGRVVVLLASPGAIERDRHGVSPTVASTLRAASYFHGTLSLISWGLAVAHDEVRAEAAAQEGRCVDPMLPKSGTKRAEEEANGVALAATLNGQPPTGKAPEVALSALRLVCLLDPGDNLREPLRGVERSLDRATAAPADDVGAVDHQSAAVAMAWSALTLATMAAATVRLPKHFQASVEERCTYYRFSLWRTAVKSVLALLDPFHHVVEGVVEGDGEPQRGRIPAEGAFASRTSRLSSSRLNTVFCGRGPLLRALMRELRACQLIYSSGGFGDGEVVVAGGGKDAGEALGAERSPSSSKIMGEMWVVRTAARMLGAALPPSRRMPMATAAAAAGSPAPMVMDRATQEAASSGDCGMEKGEKELSSLSSQSEVNEVASRVIVERAVVACLRALDTVPPDIARDSAVIRFVRSAGQMLPNFPNGD